MCRGRGVDCSAEDGQEGIDTFYLGEAYDDTRNRVGHLSDEKSFLKRRENLGGGPLIQADCLR